MNRSLWITAALLGTLASAACDEGFQPLAPEVVEAPSEARSVNASPKKGDLSIAEIAISEGFSELVGALAYVDAELGAGLVDLFLNGKDQYTVFAPTNGAFADLYALLGVSEISDLPASVVFDVLLYHVTDGRRAANSVLPKKGQRKITSLLGETFRVRTDGTIRDGLTESGVREDAAIGPANISARNGIIHVIDQVIVPPSVAAALNS